MNEPKTPGFYGKFPELGDFVNRRLPRAFLDPWDEWLQGAIATSREQLAGQWLDYYLNAPVWCFVLCSGICGEMPWTGLVMPSVDRVGRYYPLTLAVSLPLDVNPLYLSVAAQPWYEQSTDILLSALDEQGFSMEQFDARVNSLGNLDQAAGEGAVSGGFGFGSAWRIPLGTDASTRVVLPGLSHHLVLQRLGGYSLWWTAGSRHVTPSMLLAAGLPEARDFPPLLTGDWQNGNWDDCLHLVRNDPGPDGIDTGRETVS